MIFNLIRHLKNVSITQSITTNMFLYYILMCNLFQ